MIKKNSSALETPTFLEGVVHMVLQRSDVKMPRVRCALYSSLPKSPEKHVFTVP